MRTNKIKAFAICLLIAAVCRSAVGQNPTTSELLQKGIYLQETVGDLDGAIKIYRQITRMAQQSRANAAQAEYRLAICLLKKGQQAEAAKTFSRLIEEYPEQTELVAKAREMIAADSRLGGLTLLPAPWADGEVLAYTTKQKDSSIARSWYSFQSSKTDSRRWVLDARGSHDSSIFSQLIFGRVEVDEKTMQPLETLGTRAFGHNYQVNYKPRTAQMMDGDTESLAEITLTGPVFDSVELPALLRRLPWSEGYKVTLTLLWSGGMGGLAAHQFAVAGEENVQTPAGDFRCYRVERRSPTHPASVQEKYWISTDSARLLVKSDFAGSVTELSALPGPGPEGSVYKDEGSGASFNVPGGWIVTDWRLSGTHYIGRIYHIHSAGIVYLDIWPCRNCRAAISEAASSEESKPGQADKYPSLRSRGYAFSWTNPAGTHWMDSRVIVSSPTLQARISLDADTKNFDSLQPNFDAIVDSFILNPPEPPHQNIPGAQNQESAPQSPPSSQMNGVKAQVDFKQVPVPAVPAAIKGESGDRGDGNSCQELEAQLKTASGDATLHEKLIQCYFQSEIRAGSQSERAGIEKSRAEQVLWLVQHAPEESLAGSPLATIENYFYPEDYVRIKQAWMDQVQAHPGNANILLHAAHFMSAPGDQEKKEEFAARAHSLDPKNTDAASFLAQIYELKMNYDSTPEQKVQLARQSLQLREEAISILPLKRRLLELKDVATDAFESGDDAKAQAYAEEMLRSAGQGESWNIGNAVHQGNLLLGRLALKRDDLEEAKKRLLAAGKTPGSPQLDSFGPNMLLAKELLEKKQKEVVLQYFDECAKFWHQDRLDQWRETVSQGRIPNFGANLFY
ncbi:MAG TPA: tetratricopeptide repeat protein [Terriglobales bacterium]|nr:tetratricopeptide repeat protein [Terriglobales bacterium]